MVGVSLRVKNVFLLWILIELSLVLFLVISVLENKKWAKIIFIFFLMQALTGLVVFFLVVYIHVSYRGFIREILFIVFFLKMGIPPFHFWVISILEGIDWLSFFLFNTRQKVIPVIFLSLFFREFLRRVLLIWARVGSIIWAMGRLRLKMLLFYSSRLNFVWLARVVEEVSLRLLFLGIYALVLSSLVVDLKKEAEGSLSLTILIKNYKRLKTVVFMFFIRVSGLPPLMFFFLKLRVIFQLLVFGKLVLIFFILTRSIVIVYLYFRLIVVGISEKFRALFIKEGVRGGVGIFLINLVVLFVYLV